LSPQHTRPASPELIQHGAAAYGYHNAEVMSPAMVHLRQRMTAAHADVYHSSFEDLTQPYYAYPSMTAGLHRPTPLGRPVYAEPLPSAPRFRPAFYPPAIHSGGPPPASQSHGAPESMLLPDHIRMTTVAAAMRSAEEAQLAQAPEARAGRSPPSRSVSPNKSRLESMVTDGLARSGAAVAAPEDLRSLYTRLDARRAADPALPYLPGRARFTSTGSYRVAGPDRHL